MHRIAYLVRVRRENPRGILALALAGLRPARRDDEHGRLSLFAVGDDDQNIYSFAHDLAGNVLVERQTSERQAKKSAGG